MQIPQPSMKHCHFINNNKKIKNSIFQIYLNKHKSIIKNKRTRRAGEEYWVYENCAPKGMILRIFKDSALQASKNFWGAGP